MTLLRGRGWRRTKEESLVLSFLFQGIQHGFRTREGHQASPPLQQQQQNHTSAGVLDATTHCSLVLSTWPGKNPPTMASHCRPHSIRITLNPVKPQTPPAITRLCGGLTHGCADPQPLQGLYSFPRANVISWEQASHGLEI